MNASDNSLLQPESSTFQVTPCVSDDDECIPVPDNRDVLASLLATATVALHSDRRVTQRCIQRAAALLGIDLRSAGVSTAYHPELQSGLAPWQVKRLRSYIDDRLDSTIRASDLAGVVRLSTSHLFRNFRKSFGESPLAYIMKRRMRRAQDLMLTSQAPLAQVALDCGMCDQAHFSRTFRRLVGINPATWRRQFILSAAPEKDVSEAGGSRDPRVSMELASPEKWHQDEPRISHDSASLD
jgi:AraC family transcriptional regulator